MDNQFPFTGEPVDIVESEDPGFHQHSYYSTNIAESRYTAGNAEVTRVHRVLLYCQECGDCKFVADHDAPDIPIVNI